MNDIEIVHLFRKFTTLTEYREKLVFFDRHFGISPAPLDFFNSDLSWFTHPDKTVELVSIFKQEKKLTTNPYVKCLVDSTGAEFIFDISPSYVGKRIILNEYILQKYLGTTEMLEKMIDNILQYEDAATGIKAELDKCLKIIDQAKKNLEGRVRRTLRVQFLHLFFNGYYAFHNTDTILKIKRTQIELYLFGQGLLYASYIALLKKRYSSYTQMVSPTERISFEAKVAALKELGIIQYLQNKCTSQDPIERDSIVAAFIRTLIASDKNKQQIGSAEGKTILKYMTKDNNRLGLKNQYTQYYKIDLSQFR